MYSYSITRAKWPEEFRVQKAAAGRGLGAWIPREGGASLDDK